MFRFCSKKNSRRGFTLVEMVIVVAVLAILIGIMVPFFGDVQKDAEAAELRNAIQDAYTKFADAQMNSGNRADPVTSYRFVRADGVLTDGDYVIDLTNPTQEYRWDGDAESTPTEQEYSGLGATDTLYAEKYGQFYIIWQRTR